MTPLLNKMNHAAPHESFHAHLLVAEMSGPAAAESPEAVMAEVEFRATHLSSLMTEMLEESTKHDLWEDDET